jgi:hypothetical protein
MKADEMTVEKFDEILPTLQFTLLTYPTRYGFEGAGPRCLIAEYENGNDGITVLFDNGNYEVYGEEGTQFWCLSISSEFGERIQIQ